MRAFALVQLRSDATMERIGKDVPDIIKRLTWASTQSEMAFRSHDGTTFGWLVETETPLRVILASIRDSSNFVNGDSILMFEVGEQFDGDGFTRQWTWLQRTAK